jgi:Family of unknown function (DUF6370)
MKYQHSNYLLERENMLACLNTESQKNKQPMKKSKLIAVAVAAVLLAGFTSSLFAADATKEVTITGSMVCGKCTMHETKSCQNVVQVKKDGKTVNYYLVQNDTSKAAHDPICGGSPEKVTVTGTVEEKDGKEVMTPSKVEVVKS